MLQMHEQMLSGTGEEEGSGTGGVVDGGEERGGEGRRRRVAEVGGEGLIEGAGGGIDARGGPRLRIPHGIQEYEDGGAEDDQHIVLPRNLQAWSFLGGYNPLRGRGEWKYTREAALASTNEGGVLV